MQVRSLTRKWFLLVSSLVGTVLIGWIVYAECGGICPRMIASNSLISVPCKICELNQPTNEEKSCKAHFARYPIYCDCSIVGAYKKCEVSGVRRENVKEAIKVGTCHSGVCSLSDENATTNTISVVYEYITVPCY